MLRTRSVYMLWLGALGSIVLVSAAGRPSAPSCATDPKSGVQVCEITHVGQNMIEYYDVPAYSAHYDKIAFVNQQEGQPPQIMLANPDGSASKVVAEGFVPAMGPDGTKLYYVGKNGPGQMGVDIHVVDLATFRDRRITHLSARSIIEWSPPVATPKGDLLIYAVNNVAHLIYADGSGDTPLAFDDPYKADNFHRIRLSPAHPNLILYNREHPVAGHHPLWVYDTATLHTYAPSNEATHMLWAPDGLHIAYNGGSNFRLHIIRYDGKDDVVLDPGVREGTEYCSFAPEGDLLACANVESSGVMPFPLSIYLLAADGSGRVAYVCKHNAQRLTYWGWPALVFAQDRQHVLFRSDVTGKPQIYMATIPPDLDRRLQPPPQPAASSPTG